MPKTAELYLIRHGETDYNVKSIIQGQLIDCPLNQNGRDQAEKLARALSSIQFDRFYCSTLRRAKETAGIIAKPHDIGRIEYMSELQEMSFGRLEGQPYGGKNQELFEQLSGRWAAGHYADRPGQGESILDVQRRAVMAIEKIVMENPGRTVAVVTHGRLLRVLLSTLLDGYSLATMEELLHRNTAYSRILANVGSYEVLTLATDSHLADAVGAN